MKNDARKSKFDCKILNPLLIWAIGLHFMGGNYATDRVCFIGSILNFKRIISVIRYNKALLPLHTYLLHITLATAFRKK